MKVFNFVVFIFGFYLFCNRSVAFAESNKSPCVQIYYDKADAKDPRYVMGRTHALMLQNLLGHFPKYQQRVIPIEKYKSGDLERCHASFYLGTYFDNAIPDVFYSDFAKSSKRVIWLGYNIWKLGDEYLKKIWDVKYDYLTTLDYDHLDQKGNPGFYKYIDYKGEVFNKYGEYDLNDDKKFNSAYEITRFQFHDPKSAESKVVVWARHNTNKDLSAIPYVIRNKNQWYIGDSPFSFVDEGDRYLVFADLLFEILGEKPRNDGPKKAFIRLEDIHPKVPLWELYKVVDLLKNLKIPFSMTVIPIFRDPLGVVFDKVEEQTQLLNQNKNFVKFLKYAMNSGGSVIYHGVTHQYREQKNPFCGMTGDDFEFWERVKNQPIPEDSVPYVIKRLEYGLRIFDDAHITPISWVTPHYQASPLDYLLFGQLFSWNIGRVIYFPLKSFERPQLPSRWTIDNSGVSGNGVRLKYLANTKAVWDHSLGPIGQFFPYEIYGDIYGQRVIPENVGNLQPFRNEEVHKTQTIDQMIRTLKRNRVLNSDFWGSYFIHPSYLEDLKSGGYGRTPGDTAFFERLVKETRSAGYEFISLDKWIKEHNEPIRPEPIEE